MPVHDSEPVDAGEFHRIVGDLGGVARQGGAGDQGIVRPDGLTAGLEIGTDGGGLASLVQTEGENPNEREEGAR